MVELKDERFEDGKSVEMAFSKLCWEGTGPVTLAQDVDNLVRQAAEFSAKTLLHVT